MMLSILINLPQCGPIRMIVSEIQGGKIKSALDVESACCHYVNDVYDILAFEPICVSWGKGQRGVCAKQLFFEGLCR